MAVLLASPGRSPRPRTSPTRPRARPNLRCEYRVNPLGIDVTQPRLSWIVTSAERGQKQTAYQVLVASDEATL